MHDIKEAFRQGMRRLAAGVCVVSTRVDDQRYAMTASSVTSVSDSPASLLVCINQEAAMQSVLTLGQPFVINVLSQTQQEISNRCAGGDSEDRFSVGCWEEGENNMPYISDAQASFFCTVDNDNYIYGTHQIVIGRLDKVIVSGDAVNPLVYVDGAYRQLS